jgi:hypothetical protein
LTIVPFREYETCSARLTRGQKQGIQVSPKN